MNIRFLGKAKNSSLLGVIAVCFTLATGYSQSWQTGTSDWNTVGNWSTANIPDTNSETATFSSTGNTAVDLSLDTTVKGITFGVSSQNYTIGSTGAKTLTMDLNSASSGVVMTLSSATTQTFNSAVSVSNAAGTTGSSMQISTASGSTANFNGTVGVAANRVFANAGSGTVNFSGQSNLATGSVLQNASTGIVNITGPINVTGAGASVNNSTSGTLNFNASSVSGASSSSFLIRSLGTGKVNVMSDFSNGSLSMGSTSSASPTGKIYLVTNGMSLSRGVAFNSGSGGTGNMTLGTTISGGGTATQAGGVTISTGAGAGAYTNNFDATNAIDIMDVTGVISGTQVSGSTVIKTTGNGTVKFSGTSANTFASGAGTVTVQVASGTLELNKTAGVNAIGNVATSVDSGATLKWDASNQVGDSAAFTLNGGALNLNSQNDTVGTLSLASSSTIFFGAGTESLSFADSSSLNWGSFTLTITGFTQGTDLLRFGTSSAGLTAAQLSLFRFSDYGNAQGQIDANGYVTAAVAVPEPSIFFAMLFAIGFMVFLRNQKLNCLNGVS